MARKSSGEATILLRHDPYFEGLGKGAGRLLDATSLLCVRSRRERKASANMIVRF